MIFQTAQRLRIWVSGLPAHIREEPGCLYSGIIASTDASVTPWENYRDPVAQGRNESFVRNYIIKRILQSILILFCVMFIIYALLRCLPASFAQTMAIQLSQAPGAKPYE